MPTSHLNFAEAQESPATPHHAGALVFGASAPATHQAHHQLQPQHSGHIVHAVPPQQFPSPQQHSGPGLVPQHRTPSLAHGTWTVPPPLAVPPPQSAPLPSSHSEEYTQINSLLHQLHSHVIVVH